MSNIDQFLADLIGKEGLPADGGGAYAYLDSKGLVTMGVGEHLSLADFARVGGWSIGDRFATHEELGAAYAALVELGKQYQGEHPGATVPYAAEHYAKFTVTRLPVAVCMQRAKDRLTVEFLPHLDSQVLVEAQFNDLPLAVQRVLVDLAWNVGCGGFSVSRWPLLFTAVSRRDFRAASLQCVTGDGTGARNTWRRQTMLSAVEATS